MNNVSRVLSALCAVVVALGVAKPASHNAPAGARAVAVAASSAPEARVVVRLIADYPEQCPSDNLRAATYIYIEGKGTPDANGYIFATAHATTDLFVLGGNVISLAPRHHEMTYTVAVKLEQFPPVPVEGMETTHTLDIIGISDDLPTGPDTTCIYLNDRMEPETVTGNHEFAFRTLIKTIKGAIQALGGLHRNAEGVYGLEGVIRARQNSSFKYVAEWYPDKVTPAFDVQPDATGIFIGGVPIDIYYDYVSLWEDDGSLLGNATIKHGRSNWEKRQQPAPETVRKTINPGTAVGQSTQMEGQVVLNNGNGSPPVEKPYESTPRLSVFRPDDVDVSKVNKLVKYKIERLIPNPAWSKGFKFPQSFPAPFKGKDFKAKAQLKVQLETNSHEPPVVIKAGLGGEGEVTMGKVAGKLKFEGLSEFKYDKSGFDFLKGSGKADFQLGYKDKYGPFDLVPQLKPAASTVGLDEWLEQYMAVEVGLYAIAVGNVEVFKGADGIDWKAKIQPGLRVSAKAIAGKEDSRVRVEIEGKGEGRMNLYINDPAHDFFGGADGEVVFTASFGFFDNKASYESKLTFGIGNASVMQASQTVSSPQMGLVSDGYLGGAEWVADERLSTAAVDANSVASADSTTVLVTRASPLSSPAMNDVGRAACWVAQRAGVPATRDSEIVCMTGTAPSFGQPVTVTNDALADASPSVAQAGANAPIVAWWRNSDNTLTANSTLDAAYLKKTDVAVSAYDPATSAWSAPVIFGSADVADFAPQVAGNGAGRGLLVWRENSAGQIGGQSSSADAVKAVIYDASAKTWGAVQTPHTVNGLVAMHAAYGANEAALVYAIDATPGATHTLGVEIWTQRLVGGVWQAPARLTSNDDADLSPHVAYDAAGQPVLVWLRVSADGATQLMLQRGWSGTPSATAIDGATVPAAIRTLAVNANGDVVVLWPAAYEGGVALQGDLAYMVFHAASGQWSAPLRLTSDAADDLFAGVAWKNTGEFNVLYERVARQVLTSTVAIDGVITPYTYTVANPNGHDLVVLTHAIRPAQPAVLSDTLRVEPANAVPGQPVTVTMQVGNLGDLPASTVQVSLGCSDARQPLNSAVVTAMSNANLPLVRAGERVPVTMTVTLPAQPNRLHATASCTACASAPAALLTTTLPDLAVTGAGPDRVTLPGATLVRATIVNRGVISATHAQMTVTGPNGVLGVMPVYFASGAGLDPGQSAEGYVQLDASEDISGSTPITVSVALIDAAGEVAADFDMSNNSAAFDWIRLPDWSLGNAGVVLGASSPGGTPITITAYNASDVTAPETLLQIYSAPPDEGGSLLWQGPVAAAEPWGSARVSPLLPANVRRVFVRINTPETALELSTANNTARAGRGFAEGVAFRTLLPLVRR